MRTKHTEWELSYAIITMAIETQSKFREGTGKDFHDDAFTEEAKDNDGGSLCRGELPFLWRFVLYCSK